MTLLLRGEKELMRQLNTMEDRVYRKHVAKAEAKAVKSLIKAARNNILAGTRISKKRREEFAATGKPTSRTGNLRKSIGRVTRRYVKDRVILSVAGPRTGPKHGFAGNHAHLIEFGHRMVGGHVKPYPFMRPAWESTKGKMRATIIQELWEAVRREAKRHHA